MADIMPPAPDGAPSGRRKREPREQISAGLRYDILRRCNFCCYYCGVPAALGLKVLHVDHVIPVTLGGTNDPWNLVAACWDCNLGKAGLPPTPELVRQVRNDFCAYQSPREARLDQCDYCDIPIEMFEDEEPQGQCERCNDLMCDSYERALIRYGLLKRGGGPDVVQG